MLIGRLGGGGLINFLLDAVLFFQFGLGVELDHRAVLDVVFHLASAKVTNVSEFDSCLIVSRDERLIIPSVRHCLGRLVVSSVRRL